MPAAAALPASAGYLLDFDMRRASNWSDKSRHERGYGATWDKLRKLVLERDGYLCQCTHCKAEFRVTLATEVDHVVSKAIAKRRGWTDEQIEDPSNLAAINGDCHKRKTQEEQGKTIKPKIGLDGWAIL
jgi:5-methylcytosine-specific restriction protein A